MVKINAQVYIEQITDGREYKGHVGFGTEWKFNYRMAAQRNIQDLEKLSPEEANKQIDLYLVNNENRKEIPVEVLPLFRALIFPVAIQFYNNPQTRHRNSPDSKDLEDKLAVFNASMSIGMTVTPASFDEEKIRPFLQRAFPK